MTSPPRRIEPAAVVVAPELLGTELASPARRLAAMLIDLACVGIASLLGLGILAGVAAIATWRASGRQSSAARRGGGRVAAGALALMAIAMGISQLGGIPDDMVKVQVDGHDISLGKDAAQIDSALAVLAHQEDVPRVRDAFQRALVPAGQGPDAELVHAYSDALIAGDAARARELRPKVAEQVAESELRAARLVGQHARETNRALLAELEEAKTPLLRRSLSAMFDVLGLGLGWSALYFTALTAAWKGQTVGKRLLRTRVARLDGKPLTWWMAFNRYGGYAASAFLGMTGFLSILNDRHRQALHDKIAWTVVVRTTQGQVGGSAPP